MQNNYKLQNIEAICLILIIMISKLILNIPFYIIELTGTGSIINIIYIGIIGLAFVLLISKLFKNFPNSDIIDISEFLGSKFLKILISICYITLFIFAGFITLYDFTNTIKIVYFPKSPTIFILLFFIIGSLIANLVGLKSIVRTTCFIVPFALGSIFLAFFSVSNDFSIERFSPFFGYSFKTTFLNGLLNSFSFYIITYYFFIIPFLKNSNQYKKISIKSYFISWLILLFTIISIISVFPVTSNTEPINALYLMARKVQLGDFIQRLDAIFILLWILSIFCYLSISIFMVNRIFGKITNVKNNKMISFSASSILFGLCLLPYDSSISVFLENTIYKYTIIGFVFIVCTLIMIFANIKYYLKKGI